MAAEHTLTDVELIGRGQTVLSYSMTRHVTDLADPPEPIARPAGATRWAVTLAIAILAGAALAGGIALRGWVWQKTLPIHSPNIAQPALTQPLLNCIAVAQSRNLNSWRIAPAKLSLSADSILRINTLAEALSAAIAFLLVWHWVRRSQSARPRLRITPSTSKASPTRAEPDDRIAPPPDHAHWWALAAAILVWFNPSVIVDGHIALNTTIWIVPLYLAAMFAASTDFWFIAGIALSLAATINGLIYFIAPIFIIWPLIQRRPGAAVRCVLGFAVVIIALAMPSLIPSREALIWLLCLTGAAAAFAPFGYPNPGMLWLLLAVATMGLLNWQWLNRDHVTQMYMSLSLSAALLVGPWWLSKRAAPFWVAFITMLGVLVAAVRFDGSFDLLGIHLPAIAAGPAANLPAVLAPVLGWTSDSTVIFHAWISVTPRILFAVICAITILLCAIGAAIHHRRDDPQCLLALATPWVMFFALDSHMNQQSLAIAAATTAVALATSAGMTLMNLLLAALSAMMILLPMLQLHPTFWPHLFNFINGMNPSIGWMIALIAAIYLFQAIAPRRCPPVVKVVPAFVRAARGR